VTTKTYPHELAAAIDRKELDYYLELRDGEEITRDIQALTGYRIPQPCDLRDWFAGMALQGLIAGDQEEAYCESEDDEGIARERMEYARNHANSAYRYADAMLAAREETR
jgi:hypothetical protein